MPNEMEIDKDRLRELASDPNNGIKEICAGLGMSDPTFYQHLNRHPELKQVYQEARDEVRAARNDGKPAAARTSGRQGKASKGKTSKRQSAKAAKSSTPPPQQQCQSGPQGPIQKASIGV